MRDVYCAPNSKLSGGQFSRCISVTEKISEFQIFISYRQTLNPNSQILLSFGKRDRFALVAFLLLKDVQLQTVLFYTRFNKRRQIDGCGFLQPICPTLVASVLASVGNAPATREAHSASEAALAPCPDPVNRSCGLDLISHSLTHSQ